MGLTAGTGMRVASLLLSLGFAFLILPGDFGAAQGVLLEARLTADLLSPGQLVHVRASYKVLPQAGATEIPLSLLAPGATRVQNLRANLSGVSSDPQGESGLESSREDAPTLHLEEVRDHFWEGSVGLPPAPDEEGDSLLLVLSYEVGRAWTNGMRATLPLVVPRWVPENPAPRTFLARVTIPPGHTVTGSFPTSVLNRPPAGAGGDFEVGLQGIPSMLVLEMAKGRGALLTLERGLDLVVILILLAMGLLGIRVLRGRER